MGKTLLIVESNADLRSIVAEVLEFQGYNVLQAEHGRAALSLLSVYQPDCVISAWNMPEMNGFELLDAMRTSDSWHSIPVLHLYDPPVDHKWRYPGQYRAEAALRKPFNMDSVLNVIERLIAQPATR